MKQKDNSIYLQIEELEQKYGGPLISRRAACKIQTAFRQYQLSKNFQKIRNSVLESGIPRRMSVRRVRVQRDGFSAERALMEGCSLMGIPLTHSTSLPVTTTTTITHLEDTFTEQVQIHIDICITVFHEFKYTNHSVHAILLFDSIVFGSILSFVLFQSTQICCSCFLSLLYFNLVYSNVIFCCVLFYLIWILFYSVQICCSIMFCYILFYSNMLFCSVLL